MTHASHSLGVRTSQRFALRRSIAALSGRLASRLQVWRLRARQRRDLREVDDATLRDLGMSRSQARFFADRE